jgi:hypothetical protein
MRFPYLCVTIAAIVVAVPASGFDLHELDITTTRREYDVDMAFSIGATPARIIETLTDYDRPTRLNPDVKEMRIVERTGDTTRVLTEFRACALVFCKDLEMLQDVRVSDGRIVADIVPTEGQFSSGRYDWQVTKTAQGFSRVRFRATVKYEFFVMPVIGKLMLKNQLRKQLLITAENLEVEASQ